MARPIPFESPVVDPRMELMRKLERAPSRHAAALLDAYELLQTLHDRKVFDTLRGLVGSGEAVLDIAVKEAAKPASIHAMRNLIALFNVLGSIDPDTLKQFAEPIPQALQVALSKARPPGIWALMKGSILNGHFRHGLGAMIGIVSAIGMRLEEPPKPDDMKVEHTPVSPN